MSLLARRFPTILGLILLVGLITAGWYFFRGKIGMTGPTPQKVRITNTADSKFTVTWVTDSKTTGEVEYGKVGEALNTASKDDRDAAKSNEYVTHHVTVTGLQPSTQYAFRIVSGGSRFDNNGSPYNVSTGPVITNVPPAKSFYGNVQAAGVAGVDGAIVYVAIPGAQIASTLSHDGGAYSLPISTVRTQDLSGYVSYDPSATIATVTVVAEGQESTATVTMANTAPVPTITLGQNADFRSQGQAPQVAEVAQPSASASAAPAATAAGIFNVEPLSSEAPAEGEVTIINPGEDGETIATTKPEIRGTGPSDITLSIVVHSVSAITDTVKVDTDGTWSWTPPADLAEGQHTVTINYVDEAGKKQAVTRTFVVSKALAAEGLPAFESSPSASKAASATPKASVKASAAASAGASASARAAMPATGSGVPVTGVIEPTVLTGALGFAIMVLGAVLLAL